MEVTFKNLLHAYSGKCDGIVYYFNRRLNKVIARRLPQSKPHAGNALLSAISHNLKIIAPSEAYRLDLKHYTELLRMKQGSTAQGYYAWSNVFRRLMYAMASKYALNLATLTREEIILHGLPCITLKAAIDDGLLPAVPGYQRFIGEI